MSAWHSLALPLSADYAHNEREGFSFFCTSGSCDSTTTLDRYLDDLCAFLRSAGLIQSHPDNYFQLIRGERWAASSVHFDNSPVEAEELAHTKALLSAFKPLLQGDDAMSKLRALVRDGPPTDAGQCAGALAGDVGASSASWSPASLSSLAPLQEFYAATRRLMLGRARRVENDVASLTLVTEAERRTIDRDSSSAQTQQQHEQDILDLVVSQGMNLKKQHEVPIMRMTIRDLVLCCNAGVGRASAVRLQTGEQEDVRGKTGKHRCGDVAPVGTVINIGEGKGYVSRAVSLCDNLQVVGLDCNPAHKERAVERFESLVETSLSSRDGRPRVNLLYEPRGHVASIACRVGEKVDWESLLHGHVRTCADPCCLLSKSCGGDTCSAVGTAVEDQGSIAEDDAAVLTRTRGDDTVKLACRVCGKVVRQDCTAAIMKHVYKHLHGGIGPRAAASGVHALDNATETLSPPPPHQMRVPALTEVQQWNVSLPQHAYVAKLTEHFFAVTDVDKRHLSNRNDAALLRRVAVDGEGGTALRGSSSKATPRYLTLAPRAHGEVRGATSGAQRRRRSPPEHAPVTLEPAYTARGYRVVLLMAVEEATASREHLLSPASSGSPVDGGEAQGVVVTPPARERESGPGLTSSAAGQPPQMWSYTQVRATVVGYDGGVDSHQVRVDQESKKRTLRLYRLRAGTTAAARECVLELTDRHGGGIACVGDWQLPDAGTWGRERVALVLAVLPPALPSTPVVCVPSVRNTVLIGLHSCGDLGSNICRIFRNSSARGLLLVSCCWHALTPHGFPLSRALQRRGLTTNSISLLLATQPLDAWSTASPEGHRSSAKLLFFRSLFKLLWRQLAGMWEAGRKDGSVSRPSGCAHTDTLGGDDTCAFPDVPPHLEPAFLRRISREKDTLTFTQFVHAVAAEYVYSGSSKDTPYTPWNIGRCCAVCRTAQEAHARYALTQQRLPETMGACFEEEHFASFLGLTVLRMWMCHLVESLLLLDRALYLHEELSECHSRAAGAPADEAESSAVALVPLFDGALSPRMYGVLARRGGATGGTATGSVTNHRNHKERCDRPDIAAGGGGSAVSNMASTAPSALPGILDNAVDGMEEESPLRSLSFS
ncbi:Methyltransferase domain family protein [Leishmania donovani]|uniref:Methyltransferase domain family protein n=1 Tax=Leishmania donovani TaxID=5661 RepID=A0A504YA46_LEIDO|nr:Methyltransferase domain family protein [Leishmania donovani]